jgi:hypothetical protein
MQKSNSTIWDDPKVLQQLISQIRVSECSSDYGIRNI